MNIEKLDNEIIRLLQKAAPLQEEVLLPIVVANCDTQEEHRVLDEEGLDELFSTSIESQCLLSFNWISWGAPTSWSDGLYLLTTTNHHFVWLPHDEDAHPLVILTGTAVSDGPSGISGAVETCLARLFDWGLMGARLPTETINSRPDLLAQRAVKNAYRLAARAPQVWNELLEDLEKLSSGEAESMQELVGAVSPTGEATIESDSDVGTRLFEAWFRLTYSEP